MNNAKHLAAFMMAFAMGANAVLITNGDWESTLNGNWDSDLSEDTQTDLKGWFSSLKAAGNRNGAYVEPVSRYGDNRVAGLKATSADNYLQQEVAGIHAGMTNSFTVHYESGIHYHHTYNPDARNITLRVSLWDVTTDTELAGTNTVVAYSPDETWLHAHSHVLTYDNTGLDGHAIALRFQNITYAETGTTDSFSNRVLFDNVRLEGVELVVDQSRASTIEDSGAKDDDGGYSDPASSKMNAGVPFFSNGDWETTLNGNWKSEKVEDTQADLNGWFSSLKDHGGVDGAYIEPIDGYGTGRVAALKATAIKNFFQQNLVGFDAGTAGSCTVNYHGGIRRHSSYSSDVREITLRVSLWDVSTGTELAGTNTVVIYSPSETSLHARSHVLDYDNKGLTGHTLAVRFQNITYAQTGTTDFRGNQVLFDNVVITTEE